MNLRIEEDALLEQLSQLPKMYMDHATSTQMLDRLRAKEQWYQNRKRRKKRFRIAATISIPLIIALLITSFAVNPSFRDWVRSTWFQIYGNVVQLEDGVVAKFRGHDVKLLEVELEASHVSDQMEEGLIRSIKYMMVYDEALNRGYIPDRNKSERAAREEVIFAYLDDLIGDPLVVGGAEYKLAMSHYFDLVFERNKHDIIFNAKYEDRFPFERIMERGGGSAILPKDVFAAFRGTHLLSENTPDFFPERMTIDEVRSKLAYELLYQKAVLKGYTPKNVMEKVQIEKQRYENDPIYREQVIKEMEEYGLTEIEYWEQFRLRENRKEVVWQYLINDYYDLVNMTEEDVQKVIALVAEEQIQMYVREIVINENFAKKYNWSVPELLQFPEQDMPNYVIAEYRGLQITSLDMGFFVPSYFKYRFNRLKVDAVIASRILADIAKEKGYSADNEAVEQMFEKVKERYKNDIFIQRSIFEYSKLYGITEEAVWDRVHSYFEVVDLAMKVFADVQPIVENTINFLDIAKFKENYKQYWDDVIYNPRYPFVDGK